MFEVFILLLFHFCLLLLLLLLLILQEGGGQGWLHFRASLHDPVISLTAESDSNGGIDRMLEQLLHLGIDKGIEGLLDWSALRA